MVGRSPSELPRRAQLADTQAPLEHTRYAFFRALLDNSASRAAEHIESKLLQPKKKNEAILIQLTGWVERGIEKACPYMP